ncbi:MAG TPA: hypothetical protein VNZ52_01475 [Candidatus Thermoplasmatota archaeon]|nr:hypothetical protein [Candidatus Thermoplasmatota archaeon]
MIARKGRRQDLAGTEIFGTLLIFALTVVTGSVVAVFTWNLLQHSDTTPPDATFDLAVQEGSAILTRTGGSAQLPMNQVSVLWTVGGANVSDALAPKDGDPQYWNLGDAKRLSSASVQNGTLVEVNIYGGPSGVLMASISKRVGSAAGAVAGGADGVPVFQNPLPTIPIRADGSTVNRLAVNVSHPNGLAYLRRVSVNLTPVNGTADLPLHDRGLQGDLTAGDGTFSAEVVLPPVTTGGVVTYNVRVTAVDLDGDSVTATQRLLVNQTPVILQTVHENVTRTLYQNVTVATPRLAGKVGVGQSFAGLPNSATIRHLNVTNITLDWFYIQDLRTNIIQVRATDRVGHVWAGIITFDPIMQGSTVTGIKVKQIDLHYADSVAKTSSGTTCTPNSVWSVTYGMKINLLSPSSMTNPSWTCGSTSAGHYRNAGLVDPVVLTVSNNGDPQNNNNAFTVIVNSDVEFQ